MSGDLPSNSSVTETEDLGNDKLSPSKFSSTRPNTIQCDVDIKFSVKGGCGTGVANFKMKLDGCLKSDAGEMNKEKQINSNHLNSNENIENTNGKDDIKNINKDETEYIPANHIQDSLHENNSKTSVENNLVKENQMMQEVSRTENALNMMSLTVNSFQNRTEDLIPDDWKDKNYPTQPNVEIFSDRDNSGQIDVVKYCKFISELKKNGARSSMAPQSKPSHVRNLYESFDAFDNIPSNSPNRNSVPTIDLNKVKIFDFVPVTDKPIDDVKKLCLKVANDEKIINQCPCKDYQPFESNKPSEDKKFIEENVIKSTTVLEKYSTNFLSDTLKENILKSVECSSVLKDTCTKSSSDYINKENVTKTNIKSSSVSKKSSTKSSSECIKKKNVTRSNIKSSSVSGKSCVEPLVKKNTTKSIIKSGKSSSLSSVTNNKKNVTKSIINPSSGSKISTNKSAGVSGKSSTKSFTETRNKKKFIKSNINSLSVPGKSTKSSSDTLGKTNVKKSSIKSAGVSEKSSCCNCKTRLSNGVNGTQNVSRKSTQLQRSTKG